MELTVEEAWLIQTLRKIDKINPAGAGGYTEARTLETLQRIADGMIEEAHHHYKQFLKQASKEQVIDLTAYRRPIKEEGQP